LEADGIGVSVLCPAAVATDLYATSASAEVRAASYGATADRIAPVERIALLAQGMHPDEVGSYVVRAILERTFYIITHPEFAGVVAARHGEIMQAFEAYTP
jgi:NAD(P)-dependent dehydrogenase (short-subunit alcohol dehydrogenase family)